MTGTATSAAAVLSAEWEDVGTASQPPTPTSGAAADASSAAGVAQGPESGGSTSAAQAFLEAAGLASCAARIIEATEAETVEDLQMIDEAMLEQVIRAADLKLVSAKKLRIALKPLHFAPTPRVDAPQLPEATAAAAPPPSTAAPAASGAESPKAAAAAVAAPPETKEEHAAECVAICIDRSGSMGCPFAEATVNVVQGAVMQRTRMEAVKAMFYAFRDRTESLGGGHELGLFQFDDRVEQLLDLTPRLDLFEAIVDDMAKRGMTAIYSAIVEAAQMLGRRFGPDAAEDLRILVLTDGQNNVGVGPEEALKAASEIGAVVDAIIVGDRPDANLRRIVTATGGECYQIGSLGEGFELLEAESVVSLRARRGGAPKPAFTGPKSMPEDFSMLTERELTSSAKVKRAPVLEPDFAARAVVDVAAFQAAGSDGDGSSGSGASPGAASVAKAAAETGSATWNKRVLMELSKVASGSKGIWLHSGEGVHIFPAPECIAFWRVLLEGPAGSPFEGGVFALAVRIPQEYPFKPPRVTFETPVYHCNVSDSGGICLDILNERWNPNLSVPKALEAVRLMLARPDTDNALRQWIAELTMAHQKSGGADTRYADEVRSRLAQDGATRPLADWRQQWGC